MKRGTIACRRDPLDTQEWQFALRKTTAWTQEETRHGHQAEATNKLEAAQWLELKAQGMVEDGQGKDMGDAALQHVMPGKTGPAKGQQLALENHGQGEGDDEEEEPAAASTAKTKDDQVAEAEALSEVGGALPKKEAQLRLNRMVKLLKKVKKEQGTAKGKQLDETLAALQKLEKQGAKVKVEDAKNKLFDAAIQLKKLKKK